MADVSRVSWGSMANGFGKVHTLARALPNALAVLNSPSSSVADIQAQLSNLQNFANKASSVFGNGGSQDLPTLTAAVNSAITFLKSGATISAGRSTNQQTVSYTATSENVTLPFVFSGSTSGITITAPFLTSADQANFIAALGVAVQTGASTPIPSMTTSSGVVISFSHFTLQWNGYQGNITFTPPDTTFLGLLTTPVVTAIEALQHDYFGT